MKIDAARGHAHGATDLFAAFSLGDQNQAFLLALR
jgi:hypothetical protein